MEWHQTIQFNSNVFSLFHYTFYTCITLSCTWIGVSRTIGAIQSWLQCWNVLPGARITKNEFALTSVTFDTLRWYLHPRLCDVLPLTAKLTRIKWIICTYTIHCLKNKKWINIAFDKMSIRSMANDSAKKWRLSRHTSYIPVCDQHKPECAVKLPLTV